MGAVAVRGHHSRPITGVLCALAVCLLGGGNAHALDAGAAKVDLALEPGIPLDGDVARRGRGATSVHDPLYVRALYLEEDGLSLFLVNADLFAITPDLRARILELAPDVVPASNIVLTATHTFSGPGGLDRSWLARQRGGRFIPELVDAIAMRFSEAMQTAYDARVRCAIGYASGTVNLGTDPFDPATPIESRVTVLRVDDSDGNPIAVATNFGAAANTAAATDRFALSADYPGAFCNALEGMTSTATVAFFFNAETGDRAPGIAPDWSAVQTFAETLATRAKALANEITCRELAVTYRAADLDAPRNLAPALLPESAAVAVLEVDRLAMIFLPAAYYASTGAAIRSDAIAAGYTHVMTVGAANGHLGAVAPRERYTNVTPLADTVFYDPDAAGTLAREAAALLSKSTTGPVPAPDATPLQPATTRLAEGLLRIDEAGTADDRGRARGASLAERYDTQTLNTVAPIDWLANVRDTALLGHWSPLRGVADRSPLLLALSSDTARERMSVLSEASLNRLYAFSESIGIPAQRLWLMQCAPPADPPDTPALSPAVLFSAQHDADGLVVGLTLEHARAADVAVTQSSPRDGRAFVTVGFPWQLAGVCGVNDQGIVFASAPPARATSSTLSAPADVLLEDVLATASTLDEALAILTVPRDGLAGRVLVGADSGTAPQAVLVEVGPFPIVLDMVPLDVVHRDVAAPTAQEARIARLLRGTPHPSVADIERMAADRDRRATETDHVFGARTRASVVLVPREHKVRVMVPAEGTPGAFHSIRAGGGGS